MDACSRRRGSQVSWLEEECSEAGGLLVGGGRWSCWEREFRETSGPGSPEEADLAELCGNVALFYWYYS